MAKDKIQWHPAFASVLKLELREYLEQLEIYPEHQLNHKPLVMDVLIIKKDVQIKKNIGHIFKGYNIIEYKSPSDYLEINDYAKVKAYAYLYKSLSSKTDIDNMSITMVSSSYPLKLVKYLSGVLEKNITKHCDGVYYIADEIPMQIVVVDELSPKDVKYIRLLTKKKNLKNELPEFIREFADNIKDCDYEMIMDILFQTRRTQIMEVFEVITTMTQKEQDLLERIVEKFNLESKWVEKGEKKGRLEGERKRNLEVAKNLLNEGVAIELVVKVTGLVLDEVRGVKNEIDKMKE